MAGRPLPISWTKRARIQIYVRRDAVGEAAFDLWKLLDIGDFVGVEGPVFRTRTGEMTVKAQAFEMLSKAVRPLPVPKEEVIDGEKVVHDAFSDPELRYRRRYLDLTLNPEVKDVFRKRTATFSAIREFFRRDGVSWKPTRPFCSRCTAAPLRGRLQRITMRWI